MVGRQAQMIPTLTSTLDQIIEEVESSNHRSASGSAEQTSRLFKS